LPLAAIGGVTGELLKQNAQILNQISANLASFQVNTSVMISLFDIIRLLNLELGKYLCSMIWVSFQHILFT
jgi:hypothetical protein